MVSQLELEPSFTIQGRSCGMEQWSGFFVSVPMTELEMSELSP